jgi:hypothetical protein
MAGRSACRVARSDSRVTVTVGGANLARILTIQEAFAQGVFPGYRHAASSAPPGWTLHGQPWVPASASMIQVQVGSGRHCVGIGVHA